MVHLFNRVVLVIDLIIGVEVTIIKGPRLLNLLVPLRYVRDLHLRIVFLLLLLHWAPFVLARDHTARTPLWDPLQLQLEVTFLLYRRQEQGRPGVPVAVTLLLVDRTVILILVLPLKLDVWSRVSIRGGTTQTAITEDVQNRLFDLVFFPDFVNTRDIAR